MPKSNGETALAKPVEFEPLARLAESVDELQESFKENVGGTITLFDLDRLQVPTGGAKTWQVETLGGVESPAELTGVLIHVQQARQFYLNAETPDGSPPDCASPDGVTGRGDRGFTNDDDGPHVCADCPHAQWASKPGKGEVEGRGQRCGQRMHVLVLHELCGAIPQFLSIPPTGLKALKKYLIKLAGSGKRFYRVLTKLNLEATKNADGLPYSRATFAYAADLSPAEAETAQKLRESLLGIVARGVPTTPQVAPEEADEAEVKVGGTEPGDPE